MRRAYCLSRIDGRDQTKPRVAMADLTAPSTPRHMADASCGHDKADQPIETLDVPRGRNSVPRPSSNLLLRFSASEVHIAAVLYRGRGRLLRHHRFGGDEKPGHRSCGKGEDWP